MRLKDTRPKASNKPVDGKNKETVVSSGKLDHEESKNEKRFDSKDLKHAQRMKLLRVKASDINIVDVFASQEGQKLSTNSDGDLK